MVYLLLQACILGTFDSGFKGEFTCTPLSICIHFVFNSRTKLLFSTCTSVQKDMCLYDDTESFIPCMLSNTRLGLGTHSFMTVREELSACPLFGLLAFGNF